MEATQKQNQKLQGQLKTLNESQVRLQEQHKKQQEELGKNLTKMQETNSQLPKSLQQIITLNAESLKELGQAKERAKDLERQLTEARNNGNKSNGWMLVAIIAIILFIVVLFVK